jgi:hypothetical protein
MRITSDELDALQKATEIRFSTSRQIPRGAMVKLLAEDYIEQEGDDE